MAARRGTPRHKPGGLVADYRGLLHELKQAFAACTESGRTGRTALDQAEAVAVVSRPVAPKGVVDIFAAAGLKKLDISILSDEFFANAQGMPQRSLGVEQLRKLLKGKIAVHRRTNVVQARSFAKVLERTLRNYQNRTVEVAQMIE